MSGMSKRDPHDNPYRAPEGEVPPPIEGLTGFIAEEAKSEIDERKNHLADESTVRTIGLIQILMGVVNLVSTGLIIFSSKFDEAIATQAENMAVDPALIRTVMIALGLGGVALNFAVGLGLLDLKSWARWTLIIVSILALLSRGRLLFDPNFFAQALKPTLQNLASIFGMGLSIAMLILIFMPASAFVCSKHYHFVISETRELGPKFGSRDRVLLGVFLLHILLIVASEIYFFS